LAHSGATTCASNRSTCGTEVAHRHDTGTAASGKDPSFMLDRFLENKERREKIALGFKSST